MVSSFSPMNSLRPRLRCAAGHQHHYRQDDRQTREKTITCFLGESQHWNNRIREERNKGMGLNKKKIHLLRLVSRCVKGNPNIETPLKDAFNCCTYVFHSTTWVGVGCWMCGADEQWWGGNKEIQLCNYSSLRTVVAVANFILIGLNANVMYYNAPIYGLMLVVHS